MLMEIIRTMCANGSYPNCVMMYGHELLRSVLLTYHNQQQYTPRKEKIFTCGIADSKNCLHLFDKVNADMRLGY